mmetsp:Transcript_49870/g.132982  ORF Transcript_49870/g.132982 Transcript_49870/m.132982 type:complete len:235 (-) Transcript_49870:99-803(-)
MPAVMAKPTMKPKIIPPDCAFFSSSAVEFVELFEFAALTGAGAGEPLEVLTCFPDGAGAIELSSSSSSLVTGFFAAFASAAFASAAFSSAAFALAAFALAAFLAAACFAAACLAAGVGVGSGSSSSTVSSSGASAAASSEASSGASSSSSSSSSSSFAGARLCSARLASAASARMTGCRAAERAGPGGCASREFWPPASVATSALVAGWRCGAPAAGRPADSSRAAAASRLLPS